MSKNKLLEMIHFIDLPGHGKVVRWCTRWDRSIGYINVLLTAVLITIAAIYFHPEKPLVIGLISAPALFLIFTIGEKLTELVEAHANNFKGTLAGFLE